VSFGFFHLLSRSLTVSRSAFLCSCRACCASRRYYSPSAQSCSYQRGTSPRPSPRHQLRNMQ
jgi:hypothetical protein